MILVIVGNIFLLSSGRLLSHIRIVAMQGLLLGLLPLLISVKGSFARDMFLVTLALGIKAVFLPWLLTRTVKAIKVYTEERPDVSYPTSLMLGIACLVTAFWFKSRFPVTGNLENSLFVPVALSSALIGLLIIITRRKALSQAIGYLVFENGAWMIGFGLANQTSILIELAGFLDIFVGVIVFAIVIYQIGTTLDHIDMDRLVKLKG
jgi:hydrogenase-4 component E